MAVTLAYCMQPTRTLIPFELSLRILGCCEHNVILNKCDARNIPFNSDNSFAVIL